MDVLEYLLINNPFVVIFWAVVIVVVPVMLILWNSQKNRIGTIQCKRCNHIGPPQGLWVPFRGIKPVCSKCQSDDWTVMK